jgi:hypothetical protein
VATGRIGIVTELGEWSASTRFRALQHVERLSTLVGPTDVLLADDRPVRKPGRLGQARYFAGHARRYARRWRELSSNLQRYDALFVQRGLYAVGPGAIASTVEKFGGRVVLDLDDDVFSGNPSTIAKGPATRWLYGPQQTSRILQRADAVIVSTALLATALPELNVPLYILPTVPDPAAYVIAQHHGRAQTIGWAGTNGGLQFLDPLREVFDHLLEQHSAVLEVVSSARWDGPSVFTPWELADEGTLFARFDVGIMPLPDTAYARAKAGFKLLQYMAAGLPVVASPVGINVELVELSGAGYLAESPEEWAQALRSLIEDPELRSEMGRRARNFVEGYVDLEGQARTIAAALTGASAGRAI